MSTQSQVNEIDADTRKAEGDAIGTAEKDSASGALDGQGHRLHGALEEAVGKIQSGVGQAFHNPNQEAEGLGKQVTGGFEKAVGGVEEDVSKEVFHEAVKADGEYVKSRP